MKKIILVLVIAVFSLAAKQGFTQVYTTNNIEICNYGEEECTQYAEVFTFEFISDFEIKINGRSFKTTKIKDSLDRVVYICIGKQLQVTLLGDNKYLINRHYLWSSEV